MTNSVFNFNLENLDIELLQCLEEMKFSFFPKFVMKVSPENEEDTRILKAAIQFFFYDGLFGDYWEELIKFYIDNSKENIGFIIHLSNFIEIEQFDMLIYKILSSISYENPNKDILSLEPLYTNNITKKSFLKSSNLKEIIDHYISHVPEKIFDVLSNLLSNKKYKDKLYDVLEEIYKEAVQTNRITNLSESERRNICFIKQRLVNVTMALMKIYFKGQGKQHYSEFKIIENFDRSCKLLNNLFFAIHRFIRVSAISIDEYLNEINQNITYWSRHHDETSNQAIRDVSQRNVEYFRSLLYTMEKVKTEEFNKMINEFYAIDTVEYFMFCDEIERKDITDEILNDFIDYKPQMVFINFNHDNFSKMCMKIIDTENRITSSRSIKSTFLDYISKMNYLYTFINIDNNFINNLVKLYNYLNETDDGWDYNIDNYTICKILAKEYLFSMYIIDPIDKLALTRFNHLIVENFHRCYERLFKLIRKYNELKENDESIQNISIAIKYIIIDIKITNEVINRINNVYKKAFLTVGTKDKFVLTLLYIFDELLGEKRSELKMEDNNEFKPIDHLYETFELFNGVIDDDDFRSSFLNESRYLNFNNLYKLPRILLKKNKILTTESETFLAKIKALNDIHNSESTIDLDEVPDEFLDPIMGTIIKHPIMLPDSDIIMERDIIYRHVLAEKNNPFNRKELTINELESFNSNEEIKNKLNEFSKKLEDYLSTL